MHCWKRLALVLADTLDQCRPSRNRVSALRDILPQMGLLLYSPDKKVTNQTLQMRSNPDKGLGEDQQKIVSPLEAVPNQNTEGLGYSNLS